MHKQSQARTPEQIVEAIFTLDLEPIKFKLMEKEEGHGWTRAEADHYELEYKRFLALLAKFPDQTIAPSKEADKFWHGHILDTMKYAEDCNKVFGYFLHHFPYFGLRGVEDAENLEKAFINMQRLYNQEFSASKFRRTDDHASYCGATARSEFKGTQQVAYCGASKPPYCGAVTKAKSGNSEHASYCGASKAAYVGAATSSEFEESKYAAYCGGAAQPEFADAKQSAYCGASKINYGTGAPFWDCIPSLASYK